jgi:uncharacterized protein (DUF58 family)
VKRLRVWLPIWLTPRFFYGGCAIALCLALSPGLAPLLMVALLGAIALGAATILDAIVGPPTEQLRLRRLPNEHFSMRVPARISYELGNRSGRPIRFGVIETPVRTLLFVQDDVAGDVPAHARAKVSRDVTPIARGSDTFGAMYLWYENVLGLLRRRVRIDAEAPLRVYPDLSAVERYGKLHLRNKLVEAGLRRMRLRGAGTEFESLRDWSAGDEFRAIDWKATARRGHLMVAQHEVERSQNIMLVLDCGRLMTPRLGEQRKLDYAVTAALSLASIASLANDKVGLVAFASEIIAASAPRATRSSLVRLSELTYDLEPRFEESDYASAFAYLRQHLHKRSLIVFFTDVIDPVAQSTVLAEIATLARRHLVVCVFMNDEAIEKALTDEPADAPAAYRTSVALGLQLERRVAAASLTRAGVIAIDVPARKLTTALIDEYLRVKQRGLL